MPPPMRPKSRESSNIIITIKYGGLKATQFFSKYTSEAYKQLLNDLTDLGFPHPKRNNIVFISHGTLEFSWSIALHENSTFVTNLRRRVTLPQQGQFKDEQLMLRKQLSITKLTIREDDKYDPYLENAIASSPVLHSKTSGPRHSNNLPTQHPKPSKPTAERYHPYPYAPSHSATSLRSNDQGHLVSQSGRRQSQDLAAAVFLDEMETSLRPPVQPKLEPVDPVIPPPVGTKTPDMRVKREQLSPTLSLPNVHQNHTKTRSYIGLTHNSKPSQPTSQSSISLMRTPPTSRSREQPSSSGTSKMSFSPWSPDTTTNGAQRYPQLDPSQAPVVAPPSTPTHSLPAPIRDLTQEMFPLRNTITAPVDRHNTIVDELQGLKAAYVPSKVFLPGINGFKNESAMKTRLQEVEKELESERLKRLEMAKELEAERTKRIEMEAILKDVERECKSPFVVPGLLEAFIKIAQATTVAMRDSPSGPSQE